MNVLIIISFKTVHGSQVEYMVQAVLRELSSMDWRLNFDLFEAI